jgi:aspartyl-tRNA(Asn)/glutamyl-tRNA(Gln) amidotransferase subunit A
LHGIPFAAKDLLAAAGAPTTWGAKPLATQRFDGDAFAIRRLREAGAILVGKAAMIELAGGFGYRFASASNGGAARNPWNTQCWTCGSSSGAGAIVAAGLAPFAIGSETWGSILCPSAHCGVSGLRPTFGRVSRRGAMALSYSMDKLGPMARAADDLALIMTALAAHDPEDPSSLVDAALRGGEPRPLEGLRVGWVSAQAKGAAPELLAATRAAVDRLSGAGARVEEATLPEGPWGQAAFITLLAEAGSAFEGLIQSGDVNRLIDPLAQIGGYVAAELPANDYLRAARIRTVLAKRMEPVFARFDVLAGPSRGEVAYAINQNLEEAPDLPDPLGAIGNFLGLPSVGVPCGFARELPVGVQFMARALDDQTALSTAIHYQRLTDWHTKRPKLD